MEVTDHSKIAVVEWTFNCIAYLFKYLYRLLVANLIPTFDLLAPLLSYARSTETTDSSQYRKVFVGRFTAESLSFLIRKSTGDSLQKITNHIVSKVLGAKRKAEEEESGDREFPDSCAILFIETMKSSPGTLHSRSTNTISALLKSVTEPNSQISPSDYPLAADFFAVIFMDLLEYATPENAIVLFEHAYQLSEHSITKFNSSLDNAADACSNFIIPCKLLYSLASLKRGSRVADWNSLYASLASIISALDAASRSKNKSSPALTSFDDIKALSPFLIEASIAPITTSDLKYAAAYSIKILDSFIQIAGGSLFLPLANSLLRASQEKFQNFAPAFVTKFINKNYSKYSSEISYLVYNINKAGLLSKTSAPTTGSTVKLNPSSEYMKSLISRINKFESFDSSDLETSTQLWWDLEIVGVSISITTDTIDIPRLLAIMSKDYTSDDNNQISSLRGSLIGKLLTVAANLANISLDERLAIVTPILEAFDTFSISFGFVQGFSDFLASLIRAAASETSNILTTELATKLSFSLCKNLLSPSAQMRTLSLNTIAQLFIVTKQQVPKLISQCQGIDSMELDLRNSRSIPIQIKSLGASYTITAVNEVADKAVIYFLFGLLIVKFKPTTDGAMEAIAKAAERDSQLVWKLFYEWISYKAGDSSSEFSLFEVEPLPEDQSFELKSSTALPNIGCSVSRRITKSTLLSLAMYTTSISNTLTLEVEVSVQIPAAPSNRRYMTLQALSKVSWLAEEHAEDLIPFILEEEEEEQFETGEEEEEEAAPVVSTTVDSWTMKERDILLEAFSSFKNPEKLEQSDELYNRYLYLLSHSQAQIQKRALKCIDTFKNPVIHKYFENLDWLLDNVRFRDELQYLFRTTGDNAVHPDELPILLPLIIRLLFGRSQISREGRRSAVIQSLGLVPPEYIREFVLLATDRIETQGFFTTPAADVPSDEIIPFDEKDTSILQSTTFSLKELRRQMGFLSMLEDMLRDMRTHTKSAVDIILEALMYCLYTAQYNVQASLSAVDSKKDTREATVLKTIMHASIRCLNLIFDTFEKDQSIDLNSYFNTLYKHVLSPNLEHLYFSTLRFPTVFMRFYALLSKSPRYWKLLAHGESAIFAQLVSSIKLNTIGDKVVEIVIDSVSNILALNKNDFTSDDKQFSLWKQLMDVSVPVVLASLPALFNRETTPPYILKKESALLVKLTTAGFITDKKIRDELIHVCLTAMEKPVAKISLRVKGDMLESLSSILADPDVPKDKIINAYHGLANLFMEFSEVYPRKSLCKLYNVFGKRVPEFERAGRLVLALNAYSADRMGVPDYEARLEGFREINEVIYTELTEVEWKPLLYNFLYYIQDPEELATREGSAYSLRRFVDCFAGKASASEAKPYTELLESIVLPQVRSGILIIDELIRHWYINVLGHIVKEGTWYTALDDMKSLLEADTNEKEEDDEDDEAEANDDMALSSRTKTNDFFRNIVSVHIPSRQKALVLLRDVAKQMKLTDPSISNYLLPITEHYIEYSREPNNPITVAAVTTISELCRHLCWDEYKDVTRRYVSFLQTKPMNMIVNVRLITAVSNAFNSEKDEDEMDVDTEPTAFLGAILLSEHVPSPELLTKFIVDELIPILQKCISTKNEDLLRERIGLLTPIVKFLKALPYKLFVLKLPGVLTNACQVLRSRSETLRDRVRKVLREVTKLLGATYFPFLVRELRTALRRGAFLHILGFTIHNLLSELAPVLKHGDLDSCVDLIPGIMMEDIFGITGLEKEEEEYKSRLMEVKKQKSFETGELLASNISLSKFGKLLDPVRSILLYEKLNVKSEHKVEELLRRYGLGLNQNEESGTRQVLVLAYELYKMTQDLEQEEAEALKAQRELEGNDVLMEQAYYEYDHFRVDLAGATAPLTSKQMQRQERRSVFGGGPKPKYFFTENLHLIIKFVFEITRRILSRHSELLSAENVTAFVPMLGSQLTSKFEDVQIAALRLLVVILRHKVTAECLDEKTISQEYIHEVIQIVRSSPTTNTELCQSALQFMTAILIHRDTIVVPEPALAYLLERVKPDIEEPERYNTTFSFIRAVIGRAILIPEVYDIMDKVATVMVTNQTKATRDVCRNAYLEFITEYPQGKQRIRQQFKFLVDNLQYKGIDGRLSVMELIHLLIQHIDDSHLEDVTTSFFVALALVLINDDAPSARESAAVLIKQLLARARGTELDIIDKYCLSWLNTPVSNGLLLRGGLQITGLYFDELGVHKNAKLIPLAQTRISEILALADTSKQPEEEEPESDDDDYESPFPKEEISKEPAVEWGLVYFALQLFAKIVDLEPALAYSQSWADRWRLIEGVMLYPHAWIRLSTSRLLGLLLGTIKEESDKYLAVAKYISAESQEEDEVAFSYVSVAERLLQQLATPDATAELALQIAKNLVFISMQLEDHSVTYADKKEDDEATEENADNSALHWLIRRASVILRTERRAHNLFESKKAIIQFLASVTATVPVARATDLAPGILYGVYPYIEGLITAVGNGDGRDSKANKQIHEIQTLSQEAVDMVREKIGTTAYMAAYANVRQRVLAFRAERRRQRAVEAVSNPAEYAAKKLEARSKKRHNRKERERSSNGGAAAGFKRVRGVNYFDGGGDDAEKKKKKKKSKGGKSSIAL